MTNASSQFLRGANSVGASVNIQAPSDADVLNVAASPDVKDVQSMALKLGTLPALLEPVVRKLTLDGFLNISPHDVTLSPIGERALRYAKVSKF